MQLAEGWSSESMHTVTQCTRPELNGENNAQAGSRATQEKRYACSRKVVDESPSRVSDDDYDDVDDDTHQSSDPFHAPSFLGCSLSRALKTRKHGDEE
mmetsp:Transcript_56979/g.121056  ORF Transcript_56979/g.121056 Transcript_56979/m.121056 type:complete len:98 (-) Transcript_56979:192-485(-)